MNPTVKSISTEKTFKQITVHIGPGGSVYIQKYDREILSIMAGLNREDENLIQLIRDDNPVLNRCG